MAKTSIRKLHLKVKWPNNPDDHRALYSLDQAFMKLNFFEFDAKPCLTCQDINDRSSFSNYEVIDLKRVLEDLAKRLGGVGGFALH